MPVIEIFIRDNGITITGHSGYAPPGQDIVCAAVSTLVHTLVCSVEDLTKDIIEYSLQSGNAEIRFGNLSDAARLLVDSFFVGISGVAEGNEQYVQIKEERT